MAESMSRGYFGLVIIILVQARTLPKTILCVVCTVKCTLSTVHCAIAFKLSLSDPTRSPTDCKLSIVSRTLAPPALAELSYFGPGLTGTLLMCESKFKGI